jgi:PIN domain nuclease of toxin-antitoxin system
MEGQMINLDTHVLVFALSGEVTTAERRVLANAPWSISAIVLWEICKLIQLKRLDLDIEDRTVQAVLRKLHVWPIDLVVARQSTHLDFRSDPADEIIAATSIVHRVPLLTRDKRLRRSKLIPFA